MFESAGPNGEPTVIDGDGVADLTHRAGSVTFVLPAALNGAPTYGPTTDTELFVGAHMYLDAKAFRASMLSLSGNGLGPGSIAPPLSSKIKWVDMSALTKSLPRSSDAPPFGQNANFNDLVGSLEAEGVRVIDLGAATIAGVTTTHYRAVSMERTTDSKAQTAREVIDLWTDRQRRLVKMVIATKLAGQTSTATETFSDYGGPAPIHAARRRGVLVRLGSSINDGHRANPSAVQNPVTCVCRDSGRSPESRHTHRSRRADTVCKTSGAIAPKRCKQATRLRAG